MLARYCFFLFIMWASAQTYDVFLLKIIALFAPEISGWSFNDAVRKALVDVSHGYPGGCDDQPRPNREFLFGLRHFEALVDTIWEVATVATMQQPGSHLIQ